MMLDLTPAQEKVLRYWQSYQKKNGDSPSLQGAAKSLGYASVSPVQDTIKILVRKGFIKKEPQLGIEGRHIYVAVSDEQTK